MRYKSHSKSSCQETKVQTASNKSMYEVGDSFSVVKSIYCLTKTAHTCLPLNTVGLDCFLIAVIVSLSPFFHSQILSLMIKSKFNTLRMVIVG